MNNQKSKHLLNTLSISRSIVVGIKTAIIEMKTHKLRSLLSILGVMLGVASLVMMLTLIGGVDIFLSQKMGKWVGSVWFFKKNSLLPEQKFEFSRSPGLRLSDGEYLKSNCKDVKNVPMSISRTGMVLIGNKSMLGTLIGVNSEALTLNLDNIQLSKGKWFEKIDYSTGQRNCIVSWQIAQNAIKSLKLRDTSDLIDKQLIFKTTYFTITGIFNPIDINDNPMDLSTAIFTPIITMQKYITGFDPDPGNLQIVVNNPKLVKQQAKNIATSLVSHHRGAKDIEYRTADWLDKVTSMFNNISILMTIISAMSLITGGLSIMNVMLSSISERIREIGIRKALGAQRLQIFVQFIAETTTLSFSGGMIGVFIGLIPLLFKEAIERSTEGAIIPTILPLHLLYTFAIIVAIGVTFGLYPAIKASKMDPIEALRYE